MRLGGGGGGGGGSARAGLIRQSIIRSCRPSTLSSGEEASLVPTGQAPVVSHSSPSAGTDSQVHARNIDVGRIASDPGDEAGVGGADSRLLSSSRQLLCQRR